MEEDIPGVQRRDMCSSTTSSYLRQMGQLCQELYESEPMDQETNHDRLGGDRYGLSQGI